VLAADVIAVSPDGGQLEPMINAARHALQTAGLPARPEAVLADAGYWHGAQIQSLREQGITVLVPPDAHVADGPHPRKRGGVYADMRTRLQHPETAALYRRRQTMIEPIFGHTKHNRGLRRFRRRGLAACRAEWRLITASHNLLKAWRAAPAA
jgi:hypothetical protein